MGFKLVCKFGIMVMLRAQHRFTSDWEPRRDLSWRRHAGDSSQLRRGPTFARVTWQEIFPGPPISELLEEQVDIGLRHLLIGRGDSTNEVTCIPTGDLCCDRAARKVSRSRVVVVIVALRVHVVRGCRSASVLTK